LPAIENELVPSCLPLFLYIISIRVTDNAQLRAAFLLAVLVDDLAFVSARIFGAAGSYQHLGRFTVEGHLHFLALFDDLRVPKKEREKYGPVSMTRFFFDLPLLSAECVPELLHPSDCGALVHRLQLANHLCRFSFLHRLSTETIALISTIQAAFQTRQKLNYVLI